VTARGLADIAAVAIVHADSRPDLDAVARAVRSTAAHRALVEQATGAVRFVREADEGEAFDVLVRRSRSSGQPLTDVAREVLDAISTGDRPGWFARG
jgi:AmiR/NasT family two-component response regulator